MLVKDISRIDRSTAVVVRWIVWLHNHGVEIFTLDDRADWKALLAGLKGGAANE